eukprot:TRINITY_DN10049_c0_g1_i1.p1 TRINITY_DN10049_c0_g1~~TRINITY_DN10049_c0_g1_i1.p1  ORF type:complete len:290 (-),score=8.87 TRINITY_DN10049_c0_g1_i1:5-826(-)
MGTFMGHVFPGTFITIIGLIGLIRSLNFAVIRSLVQNSVWFLTVESILLGLLGFLGLLVEVVDMIVHQNFTAMSHKDHLLMTTTLLGIGLVDYFHRRRILKQVVWYFIPPFGLVYIAMLLTTHLSDDSLENYYHLVSGVLFILTAIIYTIESSIGLHTIDKKSKAVYNEDRDSLNSYIHPMYTNEKVNRTGLSTLKSLTTILNGLWWCQIGWAVYGPSGSHYSKSLPDMEAFHMVKFQLLKYSVIILVNLALLSKLLGLIDEKFYKKEEQIHS